MSKHRIGSCQMIQFGGIEMTWRAPSIYGTGDEVAVMTQKLIKTVALAYGRTNRRRKASFITEYAEAKGVRTGLLVGVAPRGGSIENIVERTLIQLLPSVEFTACGLDEAPPLDWVAYRAANALRLPFEDHAFDLVVSNAVIEHVGGEPEQRRFIEEHARVGRHWVFTTPNRAFPVEAHTHQLMRHWRASWTSPTVTRLLTKRDIHELLKGIDGRIHGTVLSPTFMVHSA